MSFVCPGELVSFVHPRELVSFDPQYVTHSPPIGKHIRVARYNNPYCIEGLVALSLVSSSNIMIIIILFPFLGKMFLF